MTDCRWMPSDQAERTWCVSCRLAGWRNRLNQWQLRVEATQIHPKIWVDHDLMGVWCEIPEIIESAKTRLRQVMAWKKSSREPSWFWGILLAVHGTAPRRAADLGPAVVSPTPLMPLGEPWELYFVNPTRNLPFGDGLYNLYQSILILGYFAGGALLGWQHYIVMRSWVVQWLSYL
jgi:hypothetical protein